MKKVKVWLSVSVIVLSLALLFGCATTTRSNPPVESSLGASESPSESTSQAVVVPEPAITPEEELMKDNWVIEKQLLNAQGIIFLFLHNNDKTACDIRYALVACHPDGWILVFNYLDVNGRLSFWKRDEATGKWIPDVVSDETREFVRNYYSKVWPELERSGC